MEKRLEEVGASSKQRFLFIDNDPIYCYGLQLLVEREEDMTVVGIAKDKHDGLRMALELRPDVILANIKGNSENDIACEVKSIGEIRKRGIQCKISVISGHNVKTFFNQLIKYNVTGFFTKNIEPLKAISALRSVANGQLVVSEDLSHIIIQSKSLLHLSRRELEILKMISQEKKNKEIAIDLCCSVSTVEYYITNIFAKLSVRTRVGAVKKAYDMGLI